MKEEHLLVSIVIPTYNHAHFLKEALESVRFQTYPHWEAIVVNNFSDDDTIPVVNHFNDARIKLINFRNQGIIASSRNEGIKVAKGQIISFLDSDDLMHPEKLERCVQVFENNNIDVVCHGLARIPTGPYKSIWKPPKGDGLSHVGLLLKGSLTPSAILVRKNALLQVGFFSENIEFNTSEDYELWLRLARKKKCFFSLNDVLGTYRIHSGNESKQIERLVSASIAVINEHTKDSPFYRLAIRRLATAHIFYSAGRVYDTNHQYRKAFSVFLKSLSKNPFRFKLYLAMGLAFINFFRKK